MNDLRHASTHILRSSGLALAIGVLLGACGGSPAATDAAVQDTGTSTEDAGSTDAGSTDAGSTDTGTSDAPAIDTGTDGGGADVGVATESPMGIDCTDACPSFEGRDYVCTFLPGFSTTLGYCSLACTTGDPTACVDTEPGEVYCHAATGRCIIGCPFAGCPHGMDCTFDFDDQPACAPVP